MYACHSYTAICKYQGILKDTDSSTNQIDSQIPHYYGYQVSPDYFAQLRVEPQ